MPYLIITFAFFLGGFFAYLIVKNQVKFLEKVLCDVCLLIILFVVILIADIPETALLSYLLLLSFTILGILSHIVSPIILNFIGGILSKIQAVSYKRQTFEQIMQSDYRMYFCVMLFWMVKIFLCIVLLMSVFKVI